VPLLSIVIPLGPGESAPTQLIEALRARPETELLLAVGPESRPWAKGLNAIPSAWGRAVQLNAAGEAATGDWIWFLHADSKLQPETLPAVQAALLSDDPSLYYGQLTFDNDGPAGIRLNEWGANLRSQWLKIPFGDQGLLLRRSLWRALGRFDEKAPYGEDHLLVWSAKKSGVAIRSLHAGLTTSARKYAQRGWLSTTAWTVSATYRQAFEEARDYVAQKHPFRDPRTAVAIFVKTPELTPVKTRLAVSASPGVASEFYRRSVEATQAMAISLGREFVAYWSVAEAAGLTDHRWQSLRAIGQGEGDLGDRLHHVYHHLLSRHKRVLLIGCDCPQLSAEDLRAAQRELASAPFVVGPARDGGFYLFGGRLPIAKGAWQQVPYSSSDTLSALVNTLEPLGRIARCPMKTDVDTVEDLIELRREMTPDRLDSLPIDQRTALQRIVDLIRA
jgi:rSAM/selenodomain-associated transferase 1